MGQVAAAGMPMVQGTEEGSLASFKDEGAAGKVASVKQPKVALHEAEGSLKDPEPQQAEPWAGDMAASPEKSVPLQAKQGGSVYEAVGLAATVGAEVTFLRYNVQEEDKEDLATASMQGRAERTKYARGTTQRQG